MTRPIPGNPGKGGALAPPDAWDPLVRITHWAVAAAVIANQFLVKAGGTVHVWIGWGVLALLALRFVWGFVGPREARFSAFPPDPRATLSHLADLVGGTPREHPSHNPAGAAMAYSLWACLVVVTLTGLVMTGGRSPVTIAEENAAVEAGDWSVLVAADGSSHSEEESGLADVVKGIHEVAANLILALALLHVAGVLVESRALNRNLVRPMILGKGRRR